jgi:thioesterase domain-containing protein
METYPGSLSQRRLWFLHQLQAPTSAYNVHVGLWLYGRLDLAALQSSLQEVVNRHETLRTTFVLDKTALVQRVRREQTVILPVKDLSDLSDPYPPAYAFARQEVEAPFDLNTGPLFRSCILRIAPEEHVLLCTMHHIITDASSMQVFAGELAALYEERTTGTKSNLPELPIQYGDYSEWQSRWLDSEMAQSQLAFWKRTLANAPHLLELPYDSPRPAEQTLDGATLTLAVPKEVSDSVLLLARKRKVTTFMVLLAAFKVLLYRYSGQPDVLVGVPVGGRSQVETEPLIGFFVDTLVLRDNVCGNLKFADLLMQVRDTTVNALANAGVPFEKIVEAVQPPRNLSFNPIFQVMFSVIKSAIRSHAFGDLQAYPYVVYASTSIVDLSATFIEDADGRWWLQFDFNTVLFKTDRIVRMFANYMKVLQAVAEDPEMQVDAIFVPGAKEAVPVAGASTRHAENRSHHRHQIATKGSHIDDAEEELLIEIWKEVLGLEAVDVHDNFFDVGGHSLLAARLTAQIQRETGCAIPVSAIFRAPTIAALASIIRKGVVVQPDSVNLKLREGDHRIPLFAVAAPGAPSLGFAMLGRHMGEHDALYKLQGTGPAVWGRPYRKEELRNLAREYINSIRMVQRSGPYCLAGMCDGVLIAQEMILELESKGEEVALFAILDTWVLENSQIYSLWKVAYYLNRFRGFPWHSPNRQFEIARKAFRRLAERNGNGPNEWGSAYWPGKEFQAPSFDAPVMLFKRPRQAYYYVKDVQMGWGDRSRSGVEICELNCGHFDFLRMPHVQVVGQRLSQRLSEINCRESKRGVSSKSSSTTAATIDEGLLASDSASATREGVAGQ